MTALPIPQPRTSGGRPPFEPPITTTFDSNPGDGDEPLHKLFADSVRHLLKHIHTSDPEQLPLLLSLIQQRRQAIDFELRFERMFGEDLLPPTLANFYSLEPLFEDDEAISTYKRLLESLQDAEDIVRAKLWALNIEAPPSEQ